MEDGRLPKNPAVGAKPPKLDQAPVIPLDVEQVRRLAAATPEHLRAAVVLGAGTGLRQGEAMAVTVDRLNFLRREVRIDRQLWTPRHGEPVFAAPKSKRGYRTIALSGLVIDTLAAHLAAFGSGQDGLMFHYRAHPISRDSLAKWIRAAAKRAGLAGTTFHDLRHHHASVLLSQGISPPLVADRLGHDVVTLLRTYGHVIRSDEDRVRQLVDESLSQAGSAEGWLRDERPFRTPERGRWAAFPQVRTSPGRPGASRGRTGAGSGRSAAARRFRRCGRAAWESPCRARRNPRFVSCCQRT